VATGGHHDAGDKNAVTVDMACTAQPEHSARVHRTGRSRPGDLRQQRPAEGRVGQHHRHPEQISEAVHINTDKRKVSLLFLAGVALLAIVPAGRRPGFKRSERSRRRARQS